LKVVERFRTSFQCPTWGTLSETFAIAKTTFATEQIWEKLPEWPHSLA